MWLETRNSFPIICKFIKFWSSNFLTYSITWFDISIILKKRHPKIKYYVFLHQYTFQYNDYYKFRKIPCISYHSTFSIIRWNIRHAASMNIVIKIWLNYYYKKKKCFYFMNFLTYTTIKTQQTFSNFFYVM